MKREAAHDTCAASRAPYRQGSYVPVLPSTAHSRARARVVSQARANYVEFSLRDNQFKF